MLDAGRQRRVLGRLAQTRFQLGNANQQPLNKRPYGRRHLSVHFGRNGKTTCIILAPCVAEIARCAKTSLSPQVVNGYRALTQWRTTKKRLQSAQHCPALANCNSKQFEGFGNTIISARLSNLTLLASALKVRRLEFIMGATSFANCRECQVSGTNNT